MSALTPMTCTACRAGEPTVTDAEIAQYHPLVPGWEIVEHDGVGRLRRAFKVKDFAAAMAFTNAIGELAETDGHHPAILTEWGRVTIEWWTHKMKGLHRNDFIVAAKTAELPGAGQ